MKKVAIHGASGFAGGELIRLLDGHPHFDPVWLIANTASGDEVSSWHSFLSGSDKRTFISIDALDLNEPDLFVLALPHGESAKIVAKLPENAKVVDLGADFRIEDKAKWEKYYSSEHAGSWTYGLPELGTNTQKVINSNKIANPGCYATAIALSLAPIIENADLDSISVVANSGTSGAGRNSSVNANIPALDIDMYGYKVGGVHQHIPEIEQSLSKLAKKPVSISFMVTARSQSRAPVQANVSPQRHLESGLGEHEAATPLQGRGSTPAERACIEYVQECGRIRFARLVDALHSPAEPYHGCSATATGATRDHEQLL